MSTYPKSPREMTRGMMYFPRMLDKIRLHARGELHEDYHKNLGATKAADGACCNFLRLNYVDLRERVLQGGTDEEIIEWCFEKGRRLNEGDLVESGTGSSRSLAGAISPRRFWTGRSKKQASRVAPISLRSLTSSTSMKVDSQRRARARD